MDFKVNANMYVKVKLNDFGLSILKDHHEELNDSIKENGGVGIGEFDPKIDEDGYYRTQLWMLMRDFGHVMTMWDKEPFDLNIIIESGQPLKV